VLKQQKTERRIDIRRPTEADWNAVLAVLRTANFDAIGSSEMPAFSLDECFVAVADGRIVGVGGYRILDPKTGKTTLLAVDPGWRGQGVGNLLQNARLEVMKAAGVKRIYTNADDEAVIAWLERRHGFRKTGERIAKLHSFGRTDKDHWVNMVWEAPSA
jgi:N-acetylglutamate synthase-like GNAT family acetyltransferase